MEINLVTGI